MVSFIAKRFRSKRSRPKVRLGIKKVRFGNKKVRLVVKREQPDRCCLVSKKTKPVVRAFDFDDHFVKMLTSSTVRLTVTELFADEWCEFKTPITKRFVTDTDATLEKEFLGIAVTQGESVVEPNRVLDDENWKAMTGWFLVWHGRSAYQLN